MGRAVYINKGPRHWVAKSVAVAVLAGLLWLIWHTSRWMSKHRATSAAALAVVVLLVTAGRHLTMVAAAVVAVGLVVWRLMGPESFDRWVAEPAAHVRRRGWYQRDWESLTFGNGLTGEHSERAVLTHSRQVRAFPKLRRIRCEWWVDRLTIRPLVGQTVEQWEQACEAMALTLDARECRIVTAGRGQLRLDVVWEDPLAPIIGALPVGPDVDLAAVTVGRREDGKPWQLRLTSNHLLIAGVTGAGKSSVIWSLLHGLAPAINSGVVELWGIDPKGGMEYTPGRPLFARFVAGDVDATAKLLAALVETMQERADRYSKTGLREHTPSEAEPLIVLLVDEMAFLTAYMPDRQTRDAINRSLATLLTQGRAVGVCVVAALQDPRKEIIAYRNLFPTKIALRLDEKSQVDMVLGDGARSAGARCDRISEATPGIAYVKVDGIREPVRVRAGYVSDHDIELTAGRYPAPPPMLDPNN